LAQHRFVLIGHGGIARSYVRIIKDMPSAEVCGVAGRNRAKVQAFADEHGIAVYGTNIGEVASRAQATAALICTPNGAHYEGVMAAAAEGLHILCEKPLAIDPQHQAEMIKACRNYGVKLSVSYMRRFTPHMQWLRAAMDEGLLGRISVVDVTIKHFRSAAYYDSWHGTKAMDGGGPFIQQGSHIIDLALWLCEGYDKVLNAACFRILHDNIETEDHGYAVLKYRNGAVGMITASTACVGVSKESIEVSGTRGTVVVNYNGIISCSIPELEEAIANLSNPDAVEQSKLMECLLTDFLHAIEEDRQPFITGESASMATELVMAIYEESI
jgi:predicted dehydrogenase